MPPRAPLPAAEGARQRFAEANAMPRWHPIAAVPPAPTWDGAIDGPAAQRFVALATS
jgi:hypothetical protein